MSSLPSLAIPVAQLDSVEGYTEPKSVSARGSSSNSSHVKSEHRSRSKTASDRKSALVDDISSPRKRERKEGAQETKERGSRSDASEKKPRLRSTSSASPRNDIFHAGIAGASPKEAVILESSITDPQTVTIASKLVFSLPDPSPSPHRNHAQGNISKFTPSTSHRPHLHESGAPNTELSQSVDLTSSMTSTDAPPAPFDYSSFSESSPVTPDPPSSLPARMESRFPEKLNLPSSLPSGAKGSPQSALKARPIQPSSPRETSKGGPDPRLGEKSPRISEPIHPKNQDSILEPSPKSPRISHHQSYSPQQSSISSPQDWNIQIETDLLQMEIRIRQMRSEEEVLGASIAKKRAELHELQMEVQRRRNELEALRVALVTQMAENHEMPPPTLCTPGLKALGPTVSTVWKSLGPAVSNSIATSSHSSSSDSSPVKTSQKSSAKRTSSSSATSVGKRVLKKPRTSPEPSGFSATAAASTTDSVPDVHLLQSKPKTSWTSKSPRKAVEPDTLVGKLSSDSASSSSVNKSSSSGSNVSTATNSTSTSSSSARKKDAKSAKRASVSSPSEEPSSSSKAKTIPHGSSDMESKKARTKSSSKGPSATKPSLSATAPSSSPSAPVSSAPNTASAPHTTTTTSHVRRPTNPTAALHSLPAPSLRAGVYIDSSDDVPPARLPIPPV